MKITNRNAREDVSGKHNDRNFNVDYADHIDQSRMHENLYWTYNGDTVSTFEEIERDFYEKHFEDKLNEQNARHIEHGNKSRVRTMLKYYHSKRTRPEDKILQIGNAKEHATKEELWDCAQEYKDRFNELYGDHCKILDMALHMDEATPHVHIRRVWIAEDENGLEYVSETQALEQLGIPRPQPDKPESKYNNPKIMITQNETELFRQICVDRGLDIDAPTKAERRKEHLPVLEYKKEKAIEQHDEAEKAMEELNNDMIRFINDNPFLLNLYAEQLLEAERKSREEKNKLIAKIVCEEYARITDAGYENAVIEQLQESNEKLEQRIKSLTDFLEKNDLLDRYDEWSGERISDLKEDR